MIGNRCRIFNVILAFGMAFLFGQMNPAMSMAGSDRDDQERAIRGIATVDSLLQVGQADLAVTTCRDLLRTLAKDPIYGWQIEGRLGVALLVAEEPAAAVPFLEAQVRKQPHEAIHHRNLGAALVLLNRRGRALSEYQVAVELAPGSADLRREFGQMLLSFGDLKNAARELQMASRLCGGCRELDEPQIALYLAAKEFQLAVNMLSRIYAEDGSANTRQRLVAAMSHADNDSALVLFLRESKADDLTAVEWRLLVEAEGRWPGDQWASQKVVAALNPAQLAPLPMAIANDHQFWGHVALNLMVAEDDLHGLWAVDHALSLAPAELVYMNNRVVLLTKLGRDDEAKEAWQRVLAIDPSLTSQEQNEESSTKEN